MPRESYWELLKQTYTEWSEDNASRMAAALAYYAIFSIAPLLIIVIAVTGFLFGQQAAQGQVHTQLVDLLGHNAAGFIEDMVRNASASNRGLWATIIGGAFLLYAATNVFAALQGALDTVFNVSPKPGRGWAQVLRERALTFLMVVMIALVILSSLAVSTAVSAVNRAVFNAPPLALQMVNVGVSLAIFTLLFAAMFKYLPDIKIKWKDTLIGAFVTAVLFTVGKWGLGFYLARPSTTSVYGAAGSLVALMIFTYYSTQIFFIGAEFTQVYARRQGREIEPSDNAVCLEEEEAYEKANQTEEGTTGEQETRQSKPHTREVESRWRGEAGAEKPGKAAEPAPEAAGETGHNEIQERGNAWHGERPAGREPIRRTPTDREAWVQEQERYPADRYNLPGIPKEETSFAGRHKGMLATTAAALAAVGGGVAWMLGRRRG